MTKDEKEKFDDLNKLMREIIESNRTFREETEKEIDVLKAKVESKHIPITLEQQILNSTTICLSDAMKKILVDDYNSPLKKLINEVVGEYDSGIKETMRKILKQSIEKEELEGELKKALIQKISRGIINGIDGGVDKVINQLKNDAVFKSELLLAVNTIVSSFNKKSETGRSSQ